MHIHTYTYICIHTQHIYGPFSNLIQSLYFTGQLEQLIPRVIIDRCVLTPVVLMVLWCFLRPILSVLAFSIPCEFLGIFVLFRLKYPPGQLAQWSQIPLIHFFMENFNFNTFAEYYNRQLLLRIIESLEYVFPSLADFRSFCQLTRQVGVSQ